MSLVLPCAPIFVLGSYVSFIFLLVFVSGLIVRLFGRR